MYRMHKINRSGEALKNILIYLVILTSTTLYTSVHIKQDILLCVYVYI